MRRVALIFALLASPLQADTFRSLYFGNPDLRSNNCFVRAYTSAHLAKNPDQMVTQISLQTSLLSPEGPDPLLDLFISLRGDKTLYHATAQCRQTKAGLSCAVDGGGAFVLTAEKAHILRLTMQSDTIRFARGRVTLHLSSEDRVFLIPNVAPENCG